MASDGQYREMAPTFADSDLQRRFALDGIVLTPLLSTDSVRLLRHELEELLPDVGDRFTGNFQGATAEVRSACSNAVRRFLEPAAERLLPGHDFHATAVFIKGTSVETDKPLHQHWTFVDETRFSSGLIWVPLDDVSEENGGLHVVVGSHGLHTGVRGTPDLHVPIDGTEAGRRLREDYLTELHLPAGTAAIMDDRLLHGSSANRSGARRVAVGLAFHPSGAELYHFHRADDEGLLRFSVEPEFFLEHDWPRRPSGTRVRGVTPVADDDPPDLLEQLGRLGQPGIPG